MTRTSRPAARGLAPILTLSMLLVVIAPPTVGANEESQGPRRMRRMEAPSRAELTRGEAVLPFHHYFNRPVVELTLDGEGPYRFILDTGASMTVIDAGLADELGLPEIGRQELGSPAGEKPMDVALVRVEEVGLDGMVIRELKAATMDLASYFGNDDAPRGVLSARVFTGSLLMLDYPGEKIVVRPGSLALDDGRRVFQYKETDPLPTVILNVAGKEIESRLDTGSPATFSLPGSYMKSLPLKSEPVQRGTAKLVDAEITIYGSTLDGAVTLGEYTYENPEVSFADRFPVGNLGYGFLSQYEVTLDFEHRRIRLDRVEGAVARASASGPRRVMRKAGGSSGSSGGMRRMVQGDPSRKRYGIIARGVGGDGISVDGVEPGSPAEAAGLMAGDLILALNGTRVAGLSAQERMTRLRTSPLKLVVERDGAEVELEMTLPE